MKIATVSTCDPSVKKVSQLYDELIAELEATPDCLFLGCSTLHDLEKLVPLIQSKAPNVPLHGGTSCLGVMTHTGAKLKDGYGLALLGINDPDGNYGVGAAVIDDDPDISAQNAIKDALKKADCPGEVPAMVWLTSAPGNEEMLIKGISDVLGEGVPVAGGSAADNTVEGKWKLIANDQIFSNAVVVTALFPSTDIMFAFHSGYEPTDSKGIITKASGFQATDSRGIATKADRRILNEIDNLPAAEVYNEWADGLIADKLGSDSNILSLTTLSPLGRIAGLIRDVPFYRLSHPDAVTSDGSLRLFSDIETGDEVVMMKGNIDSLIIRAGRVAISAIETYSASTDDIAGAMVVYCAGCMLTVQDRLDEVVDNFKNALPDIPFMGVFTFGEQGCFLNGENHHGNLMISVLLFSK